MTTARYRECRIGGSTDATLECRADGVQIMRSSEPLGDYPRALTERLAHWAETAPDRVFAARRAGGRGDWVRITYAQMMARAERIAQALVDRGLSAERPVAILSENDLEHLTLAMGALWAGIPWAPISPAYSRVSKDHAKLKQILAILTPGLVFASGPAYANAIAAAVPAGIEVVLAEGALEGRAVTPFAALDAAPGTAMRAAHAAIGPDTIAKFLFTSGSTREPKGVINTHRMLCANQQMIRQALAFLADAPPVLVDWLPWNHTFGGNHNVGIVLYNGGTLHIDDGRPTPAGFAQTVTNLREIAPTVYFNVPKGFEDLSLAMESDRRLRETLFSRVQAFMFAGAGLSQAVWDRLERLAEATVGERIRVLSGLGMTEGAPSCTFAVNPGLRAGHVGLPCPGVDVKLAPTGDQPGDKIEARFRGPNMMPGYWRAPAETAAAFDEEGFYRSGDAVKIVDPTNLSAGLAFDGRVAEDFKLASGTFVSVGPLRARVIAAGDPLVQDVVIAGLNRDEVGLLVFPRVEDVRRQFGLAASLAPAEVLAVPAARIFFQSMLDRLYAEGTGSASRPARAILLDAPPSIDAGEVTDKGSINQRAVLARRAGLVERLYAGDDPAVFVARRAQR